MQINLLFYFCAVDSIGLVTTADEYCDQWWKVSVDLVVLELRLSMLLVLIE